MGGNNEGIEEGGGGDVEAQKTDHPISSQAGGDGRIIRLESKDGGCTCGGEEEYDPATRVSTTSLLLNRQTLVVGLGSSNRSLTWVLQPLAHSNKEHRLHGGWFGDGVWGSSLRTEESQVCRVIWL